VRVLTQYSKEIDREVTRRAKEDDRIQSVEEEIAAIETELDTLRDEIFGCTKAIDRQVVAEFLDREEQ